MLNPRRGWVSTREGNRKLYRSRQEEPWRIPLRRASRRDLPILTAIRVRLGAGDRERLEAVIGSGTARRSISGGRGLCCQRHRRSPGGHQSLLAGDQRQPQTFVWTGDPSPSSKRSAAGNKVL